MDGRNMRDLLERPDQNWERPVFLTYTARSYRPENQIVPKPEDLPIPWYAFVIKDRLKYIQTFVENEIPELYHIDNDPDELRNLALLPQYQQTVFGHQEMLKSELERTEARFVDNLPSVREF